MSIIYCEQCHKYIDTDYDVDHEEEEHETIQPPTKTTRQEP